MKQVEISGYSDDVIMFDGIFGHEETYIGSGDTSIVFDNGAEVTAAFDGNWFFEVEDRGRNCDFQRTKSGGDEKIQMTCRTGPDSVTVGEQIDL